MSGRSAWRRAVGIALAGLGVGALASCSGPTTPVAPVNDLTSYTLSEPVAKLILEAPAGNVDITGGDGPASTVQEKLKYAGDRKPEPHHDLSHGTLRLGYSCPSGTQNCDVDYRITVPRAAKVVVHVQAGRISLANLDTSLSVDTQAAEVTGVGLRANAATVTSQAGAVTLTFLAAPRRVDVRTEVGAVRVVLPKGEPYAVDASTTVGATEVTVPTDPQAPRHITVQTTTGTASVVPG